MIMILWHDFEVEKNGAMNTSVAASALGMLTLYMPNYLQGSLDKSGSRYIQLTVVISTSLISNNRLSRSEILVPA